MKNMDKIAHRPEALGRHGLHTLDKESISVLAIGLAVVILMPMFAGIYTMITMTIYISMAMLALSLGLVWGYGGIFCLGQAAFFGLGAYAYAVVAINADSTYIGAAAALLIPMAFAAVLGYFLFWGRIGDVYVGVITLTVTLIFTKFLNGSAGDAYTIGIVPLGGFNGIPMTPPLSVLTDPGTPMSPEGIFELSVVALLAAYLLCRLFLSSDTGRVMVAIRENELRAELLGYDVRIVKLITFVIGGGIAGLAGLLFANCLTITPDLFSLSNTVQVVIWVLVGGRTRLIGPVVGCLMIQYITSVLGVSGILNPEIILGAILVVFVLFLREGIVPAIERILAPFWTKIRRPSHV